MSVIFARDSAAVRNSEVSAWLEAPPYDTQTPIRTTKNSLIFSDLFDEGVAVESLLYFRNSRFPSIESNFNSTFDYREDLSRQRHPVLYREAPPRYPATPSFYIPIFCRNLFPFIYFNSRNPVPFYIPKAWKGWHFRVELVCYIAPR